MTARRIVLLGDSIIDNGPYVLPGQPDVAQQLATLLPEDDIEKRALDGAVCADVLRDQTTGLRPDDRVVLSVGGNDALSHIDLIYSPSDTDTRSFLAGLWQIRETFRNGYASLLDVLNHPAHRVLVLTIYNPSFVAIGMEETDQQAAEGALSIYNDVIQQEALRRNLELLDLRALFSDIEDYANPVEPSAIGGLKLAAAIRDWAKNSNF